MVVGTDNGESGDRDERARRRGGVRDISTTSPGRHLLGTTREPSYFVPLSEVNLADHRTHSGTRRR